MNREQIETTPAGPDLDRLVAEAKGYEEPQWDNGYFLHEPPQDDIVVWFPMPPWSTDIAAAWELVEEMNCEYEITINRHPPDGQITCSMLFIIGKDADFDKWYFGGGRTVPEAITRAYLLAKLEAEP